MKEMNRMKLIMLRLSAIKTTIFRNNVGVAWIGRHRKILKSGMYNLEQGDVVIQDARVFHAGLIKGSSDCIGWTTMEIGGNKIAVFTAVEIKNETGTLSPEQSVFIQNLRNAGGIAGVARTPDDAERLIVEFKKSLK